jgi:hypothetical protein
MNTRKLTVLTAIAGILALGEFASAVGSRAPGQCPARALWEDLPGGVSGHR